MQSCTQIIVKEENPTTTLFKTHVPAIHYCIQQHLDQYAAAKLYRRPCGREKLMQHYMQHLGVSQVSPLAYFHASCFATCEGPGILELGDANKLTNGVVEHVEVIRHWKS